MEPAASNLWNTVQLRESNCVSNRGVANSMILQWTLSAGSLPFFRGFDMRNIRTAVLIALSLFAVIAIADAELETRLGDAIKAVLPDAEVTSVSPGPLPGLYEVMLGPSLLYITKDGRYIVKGDIFDLNSLENVSKTRRAQARIAAFASLGAKDMIEFAPARGKATRTLYVYTDIDCAYCRKMHQEIDQLNDAGIAVRYLAYPRTGIGGESYDKAVSVWCAADRKQAMTAAKGGKTVKSSECANPVNDHYRMGEAMGVRGTPAVYLDDGESIGGYIPAQEMIRMLGAREG